MPGEPARWTEEELAAYMARFSSTAPKSDLRRVSVVDVDKALDTFGHPPVEKLLDPWVGKKPKSGRTQPKRGIMNKTESAYALFLDQLKVVGQVQAYRFESITLKLAEGCRYTPDFEVTTVGKPVALHEVKLRWRTAKQRGPNMEADARVKLLTAAKIYPEFDFVLAWFDGCTWHTEPIEK